MLDEPLRADGAQLEKAAGPACSRRKEHDDEDADREHDTNKDQHSFEYTLKLCAMDELRHDSQMLRRI
jgi:hypothetical protein